MRRFVFSFAPALVLVLAGAACGGAAAIDERPVSPEARTPRVAERVSLPSGASASAVWVGPRGDGIIALRDGRLLAIDARGAVRRVDRVPGEIERARDAPVLGLGERAADIPLAFTPDGALVVERGMVRRAALPAFLHDPRSFAQLGAEALWATPDGLFSSVGDKWLDVQATAGTIHDATQLLVFGRDAWVHAGTSLQRLRVDAYGAPAHVTWSDAAPGIDLGPVTAIARVDAARGAVVSARGVTIVGPDHIRTFRGASGEGLPQILGGGGGWAWVGWGGRILRTDGERWELVATGVKLGDDSRIAVDGTAGSSALVIDAAGGVLRIEAADALRSSGLADGAIVTDTRVELEALLPAGPPPRTLRFEIDGKPVQTRDAAPWGWGADGGRARDLLGLRFGAHTVAIVASWQGKELRRSLAFDYVSPLGRVPTYGADVVPIFAARCARCHANGVARDLASYKSLRGEATQVRAAVREGRMPPDILLDPASSQVLTAWVDGDAPR